MNEVELDNGGVMEWDDDGTIRYRDVYGNTENVWRPGDEGYDGHKETYFSEHVITEGDEDFLVP